MESILTESALAVVQSGVESAKLQMIESRLDKQEAEIIEELKKIKGNKALNTALGAFYIKATDNKEGGVEFYHKSFSEFLFAKRIYFSFEEWVERKKRNKWVVDDEKLAKEIYDLLGYGGLTLEIMEYLRGLLDKNTNLPENDDNYFAVDEMIDLF